MKSAFNMLGLGKPKAVTCAVIGGTQEIFHPKVDMDQETFNSLWNFYSQRTENERFIAIVQHEGLNEDGTPKNSILINIELAN